MTHAEVQKRLRAAVLRGGADTMLDETQKIIQEMLIAIDTKDTALSLARLALAGAPKAYLTNAGVLEAVLAIELARLS